MRWLAPMPWLATALSVSVAGSSVARYTADIAMNFLFFLFSYFLIYINLFFRPDL
jgi:hypothetical protein